MPGVSGRAAARMATPIAEAIVLAGGLGTRLREVVSDVPKPLAPVAGRPFLLWLLAALRAGGVRRVVLATGYRGDLIADAVAGIADPAVTCVREAEALGTGGAIRDALPATRAARLLVLNGDTYARVDYAAMARATAGSALALAVHAVPDRSRFGAVMVEGGRVRGFAEKSAKSEPGRINCGVYIVQRDLPALQRPGAFSFERDVLQTQPPGQIAAFDVPGPFIDIGTPEDYARAQTLLPGWLGHDDIPPGRE